ncbi:MAG: hypothetical protein U9N87_08575, partial [Planctomycetota bacterium]|nr:hypothetical protein [Planctomycetota bacterium]
MLRRILSIVLVVLAAVFIAGCPNPLSDSETYGLTYDGNGNTAGDIPAAMVEYEPGATVTVRDNTGNLTKAGH